MKTPHARTSISLLGSRRGRWIFAGLVSLVLVFLVLGRIEHPLVVALRAAAADVARPALELAARPLAGLDRMAEWFRGMTRLAAENARLREENARLARWRDTALVLERENNRLRTLLNAPRFSTLRVVTPRVIGVAGGPFVRSILINAGHADGVREDQAVVDELGLVGRVVEVGSHAARVLLVTDLNSRVPVRDVERDELAILRGRNDALLELAFLPPDTIPKVGDLLVTSGDGGIFPPDIPVGRIAAVEQDLVMVTPIALLDRLDFVQVLGRVADVVEPPDGVASP